MRKGLKYAAYIPEWKDLYEFGFSFREISKMYGIDAKTVNRTLEGIVEIRPKSQFEQFGEVWLDMYSKQGITKAEIARRYKTSDSVVGKILALHGVEKKKFYKKRKYEHLVKEFIERYQNGESLGDIASRFDIDKQTVLNYLNGENVEIRSLSEAIRFRNINETYFDEIDSRLKAFYLGLLFATSSLLTLHNSYSLQVSISQSKIEVIKPVLQVLKGEEENWGYLGGDGVYRIRMHSEHLYKRLKELGMGSKKNVCMAKIQEEYLPSFLAGYFEVKSYFNKGTFRIVLPGSYDFLTSAKRVLVDCADLTEKEAHLSYIKREDSYRLTITQEAAVIRVSEWLVFETLDFK